MIYTAEAVSSHHPDKICDQIADALLDYYLHIDPESRVALEVLGGHGQIVVMGEVTSKAKINIKKAVNKYLELHTHKKMKVISKVVRQSVEISKGVDKGGAGDQGIMIGYACNENEDYIPQELYVARKLLKPFIVDAKSQVTIKNGKVTDIVLSVVGKKKKALVNYVMKFLVVNEIKCVKMVNIFINSAGSWTVVLILIVEQ